MKIRRLAVVVNPHGGKRNGIRVLERIRHVFDSVGIELEILVTQRVGHATEIAKNLDLQHLDGICVVGGDGTFHEVANGLMQRGDSVSIPLGIIPAGTGNSLAQHLQCRDPIEAARCIVAGLSQSLDVVRVTLQDHSVHCINIVGWGAVSDINSTAERMRFLGPTRYTLAALWHILTPKVRRATLVLDDRTITDDFLFVIACNTKYTGAGMKLAPDAEIGDGKIDVNDLEWHYLQGDGDVRSDEIKTLCNEADIIITNPPFSLFREFLTWITLANKQFLIIGNINVITYKEVFPLIKENKLWLGTGMGR